MAEEVFDSMNRDNFDFAINTGDFVNTGTEEEYLDYLELIRSLKFPTINVLGNHDLPVDSYDTTLFKKHFGPDIFYFDYRNARFIILNNSAHEFGDGQREWLDKTLSEAGDRLKFVFMHIPTFNPSRRRHYLIKWDEDYKPFEKIIQRHKVDILFTGHIHFFHDSIYQGVRTIITGGAGAPLYEAPERGGFYHWVKVQVNGKDVRAEPVIVPTPSWARVIYRIIFFFKYDLWNDWKVYGLAFMIFFSLMSIILLKIRRKRGNN
jgi:3',5'-cyclic AMP phosphodiesterase CpdA